MLTLALIAGFTVSVLGDEEKEETISMDKVPKAVKEALAKYASESEVKNVEKGEQNGKKVYEFDIEHAGRKFEVAFTKKGKYMGTEEDVDFSTLPDAVQKALTALAGSGKLSGFEKAVDADNKITYEADLDKDGKKSEVAVDADGKVINSDSSKEGDEEKEGKESKEGKEDKD